ncbi:MAG: SDR family NAD(P)-dependent oxidoreductase, partial [Planctomycetes bacterium]|nr:SDR family NAD(P)-dependent oxidoreductase [Planctomycetota bacterium]
MQDRWTQEGARQAVDRWDPEHGRDFALRLYSARLIGADSALVLHGGGNVSFKATVRTLVGDEVDAIHVKGSGVNLIDLEPGGLPALDLAYLRRLEALDSLDDTEMVNQLRTHLFDASAPTPSIETLLHVFLPHRVIDHSHPDALLALTNQPDGESLVRQAVGDDVPILPYVRPGFELAKAVADLHRSNSGITGIVLARHGLVTFGDNARESYQRHIELVSALEQFLDARPKTRSLTPRHQSECKPADLAARVAPMLRGLVASPTSDEDRPYARSVLEWRATEEILQVVNSAEAATLAAAGPLTGDHLIHTKPHPLFVADPNWSHDATLRSQLEGAVKAYVRDYLAYVAKHGGSTEDVDPMPRVVWMPGVGLLCWATSKRHARVIADIAEHTLLTKARADAIGEFRSLCPEHLYDMEYRVLQRVKLKKQSGRTLEGQIVAISGGGGAIGSSIAEVCAAAGAHVALTDIDQERLDKAVRRVEKRHGPGSALGVVMDVTHEASVHAGFEEIVRTYGGVDVVVPNAGVAHVSSIENMKLDDFARVMAVNATGCLLFMKEGIRILKQQDIGGNIVINASKNVFGPGKDFGAYSASKAAGHQLGKVAAIELAPMNIRVN